jgi:hypothetical protein
MGWPLAGLAYPVLELSELLLWNLMESRCPFVGDPKPWFSGTFR